MGHCGIDKNMKLETEILRECRDLTLSFPIPL